MEKRKWMPWLLFAVGAVLFTVNLRNLEILMIDTRFALFVHELAENGVAPFPQLYGNYYPDYTSIPVILMYGAARLTGSVDYLAIVLPTALAAALLLVVVYQIGCRIHSAYYGLAAVLMTLGAYEFISIGRMVSLDVYPALAAAIGFYLVLSAEETGKQARLLGLVPLFAAGFLARGPIGTVVVTAVIVGFYAARGKFRAAMAWGATGAAVLAGLLLLWAHFARVYGGDEFYQDFWAMQIGSRLSSGKPPWYFFTNAMGSFAFAYPLAFAVLAALIAGRGRAFFRFDDDRKWRDIRCLAAWLLIVVLGMSVPGTKHLRYITAAIPAAGLLAAWLLLPAAGRRFRLLGQLRRWFFRIGVWIPAALFAGLLITAAVFRLPAVAERIGATIQLPLLLPGLLLLAGTAAPRLLRRRLGGRRYRLLVLGALTMTIALARVAVAEPVDQQMMSSRQFVADVEQLRADGEVLHFAFLGPDGDENKYMIHVDRDRRFVPEYVRFKKKPNFQELRPGALIVARIDYWEKIAPPELQASVVPLCRGEIGRRQCVLLRKR
jgi:4-amino-4-deoxy-L-arabinose transferase-like glycosyltransferase